MFNIYKVMFLALKKVRMVKITSPQIPTTRSNRPPLLPLAKFPIPPNPLTLFGKPCGL